MNLLNLDDEEIKTKPLKLYYYFNDIDKKSSPDYTIKDLNKLINSKQDINSPFVYNKDIINKDNIINSSDENELDKNNFSPEKELTKTMKFSNYFYTYYIRDQNKQFKTKKFLIFIIFLIVNLIIAAGMLVVATAVLKLKMFFIFY